MPFVSVFHVMLLLAAAGAFGQIASAAEPTQPMRPLIRHDGNRFVTPTLRRPGFTAECNVCHTRHEGIGTVALTLEVRDRFGRPIPFDNGSVVYTVDGDAVSPPVGPPYSYQWDSTTVAEGAHALGVILLDGPPDIGLYRVSPTIFAVDNVAGPVLAPQELPAPGIAIQNQHHATASVDWVQHDTGDLRTRPAPEPLPYRPVPPANTHPDPLAILGADSWVLEALTEGSTGLYGGKPAIYRDRSGNLLTGVAYQSFGSDIRGAQTPVRWAANFDGVRNDNSVTPYSTYVPDPAGPGWVGVDIAGRVFKVGPDGAVSTIAGRAQDPDVVPYDPFDRSISDAAFESLAVSVGTFEGGIAFNAPTDLAFDPRNPAILYVADYANHRIAKVDLSVAPPRVSTYAGTPGVAGFADGPALGATFSDPVSIAAGADGTLYVADEENEAIRTVSPDGSTVSTLARNRAAAPLLPFSIRLDSNGDIIVAEASTGILRKVLAASGDVSVISSAAVCGTSWVWIDVDRRGNVGPVDDILMACSAGGGSITRRIAKDGSRVAEWPPWNGTLDQGGLTAAVEPGGHYAWVVAIDDEEARVVYHGFGGLGLRQVRMAFDDDPDVSDYLSQMHALVGRGRTIMSTGTVPGFPLGARPSFTALRGITGHGHIGQVASFDELSRLGDAELASYIQAGMGGAVPRPEITGRDLDDFIYFIRINSLQVLTGNVPRPQPPADSTAPVIENLTVGRIGPGTLEVTWQTDEPTIGVVAFGTSRNFHRWSDIELGYATNHRVLLEYVPEDKFVHFAVLSKDEAGNQTLTADRRFDPSVPPPPAVVLTAVPTTVLAGQSVTLQWASTAATTCMASGGWAGDKGTDGQQGRGPLMASTTLTLTCTGDGGTATASADIEVLPPPPAPMLTFTATPTSVPVGGAAMLNWSAENATGCTAVNNWSGAMPTAGSSTTGPVSGTTIYSLVCSGPGGQVTQSVFVTTASATPSRRPTRRPARRRR